MENETEYFTTTIADSPSNLEGEVTILLDEDGEMVLNITQTLSGIEQNEEGSVVIITTDESNVLNQDSVVTYNVLSEASGETPLSFQSGDTYIVQGTPSPNTSLFKNKESVSPVDNVDISHSSVIIFRIKQVSVIFRFNPPVLGLPPSII